MCICTLMMPFEERSRKSVWYLRFKVYSLWIGHSSSRHEIVRYTIAYLSPLLSFFIPILIYLTSAYEDQRAIKKSLWSLELVTYPAASFYNFGKKHDPNWRKVWSVYAVRHVYIITSLNMRDISPLPLISAEEKSVKEHTYVKESYISLSSAFLSLE